MYTKDHNWETFRHPNRDRALTACHACGVVRHSNTSRQGLCSERGLREALITQYGYSPQDMLVTQAA